MLKNLNIIFILVLGTHAQNLNISVYYETLCPDSIEFIIEQLFPTYKQIGNKMNLDLIPFGKARVVNDSGKYSFFCQHGPKECHGNKIHSCAIALYSEEEGAEFVYCSMNSFDPSLDKNLEQCANSTGISWASLEMCYKSGQADKLLELNGLRTRKVQPKFVPTIIFNNHFNETLQNDALRDLLHVVCDFLQYEPDACGKHINGGIVVDLI